MMLEALARLERAFVYDGGRHLRCLVLDGAPAEGGWPEDLPPLPADARAWLTWRGAGEAPYYLDGPDHILLERVAIDQAAELTRELQADLPGYVLLFDASPAIACDGRGMVARVEWQDEKRVAVPLDLDIAGFIDRIAAGYAERRHSPWRRVRIAVEPAATWSEARALENLDGARAGTAIAWSGQWRTRRRAYFAAKLGDSWATTLTSWNDDFDPAEGCSSLRTCLACGDVEIHDSAELAAEIEQTRRRDKPPHQAIRGSVYIWTQPTTEELLARFADATRELPIRFAPGADDPKITDAALRALYAFANGSETALYFRYRLAPIAEARETSSSLLALARAQFGAEYWHPSFVPFLDKGNGDNVYVDVEGIHGPPGALVDFDHERPGERRVLYDGVTQWLECLVAGIEAGIYAWEDEALFPRFFLENGDLFEIRQHDAIYTNDAYPWTLRLQLADQ